MSSPWFTTPTNDRQKDRTRSAGESSPGSQRPLKRESAPASSPDTTPEYRLAIDFGTKFTSVACSVRNGTPFTIQEFPDDPQPGMLNMQVPTEILYLLLHTDGAAIEGIPRHIKVYGYEIQARRTHPNSNEDGLEEISHITNVKLLLDKTVHLRPLQKNLREKLRDLKIHKAISKNEDVISDLLTSYLQHTNSVLRQYYGLKNTSAVEITFCVPVCWDPSANAIMSSCLQKALGNVRLGVGAGAQNSYNLFMVNEAEAAAMHTLTSHLQSYDLGEAFLLLDCGGGTTDLGIYEIGHDYPFRLGKQINHTSGAVCGSGDLNQAFFDFALKHLQNATFASAEQESLEHIIDMDLMPHFEGTVKRSFSLKNRAESKKIYPFRLRGLQQIEGSSRIKAHTFVLSYDDMEALFVPTLTTIADLMKKQLIRALRTRYSVNKVVVAGGFGDSPALKEFLAGTLDEINREYNTKIDLATAPQNTGAAGVALGALMRATDKEHGPEKIPCQSIGIYHHVQYEPETYPGEVLAQHDDDWEVCDQDGEEYIKNTIKWVIKKGHGDFNSVHECEWPSMHIFTPGNTRQWLAEHVLFASDSCTEDYFKRSHPNNRGKTHKIGKVVFDLIPIMPYLQMHTADGADDGQDRYEVVIRIKMKIIDKHLNFTAYYPASGVPQVTIQGVHEHLNVVSAFQPGTK
ncbi:hypothetical protein T440DRAFT_549037 [Plenodomus tracheiphilus IPT5]|uniref:Actin-like ATPase domain-containing protein n=1 Tax=Plenodomus tracheiphilus IPT5 TaxID=1408161 RepID=A0A6A7BF52_9PLEO|nr:hypothetical protein T440DRAFT_549037 [Plenodomus tracheiphilus IPT5]